MSRYNKTKSLEWGSASRTKTSNKLGSPVPEEGSDGDIQVRQTDQGVKLFAKLGGRWLSSALEESDSRSPKIKMFLHKFQFAADTDPVNFELPDSISPSSIVGINLFINHSTDFYYVQAWGSQSDDSSTKFRAIYNQSTHVMVIDELGTQIDDGKLVKVIVFYI